MELLKLENLKKDYNSVAEEIDRLREFLKQQSTEVTEYDELLVLWLIEKTTVYAAWFEVKFKSGAEGIAYQDGREYT